MWQQLVSFLVTVMADVTSYIICKWLDSNDFEDD